MPNQSIATPVANQFKPVPLTLACNSRYPVCALEKDSAGFGDLILHKGASRCQSGFFCVCPSMGGAYGNPSGLPVFLCAPVRQPASSCPPCLATGRQAFNLHRGGNHA